jgi:hypothetical protein
MLSYMQALCERFRARLCARLCGFAVVAIFTEKPMFAASNTHPFGKAVKTAARAAPATRVESPKTSRPTHANFAW